MGAVSHGFSGCAFHMATLSKLRHPSQGTCGSWMGGRGPSVKAVLGNFWILVSVNQAPSFPFPLPSALLQKCVSAKCSCKSSTVQREGWAQVCTHHFHCGQYVGGGKPFLPAALPRSESLVSLCAPWPLSVSAYPKCLRFEEQPNCDTGSTSVNLGSPGHIVALAPAHTDSLDLHGLPLTLYYD